MSLRSHTKDEKPEFVIPAWIAGIQVCKDASGDIHVDLDSSPPCWNDGIDDLYVNRAKHIYRYFQRSSAPGLPYPRAFAKLRLIMMLQHNFAALLRGL